MYILCNNYTALNMCQQLHIERLVIVHTTITVYNVDWNIQPANAPTGGRYDTASVCGVCDRGTGWCLYEVAIMI